MGEAADKAAQLLTGKQGEQVAITETDSRRTVLISTTYLGPVYDLYHSDADVCAMTDGLGSLAEVQSELYAAGDGGVVEADTWIVRGVS